MLKVVGCGLSGLIGKPLAKKLAQKFDLVVLKHGALAGNLSKEVEGVYAVINLCGEPIAGKRWTQRQKKKLRESRISTTRTLVDAIAGAKNKPKVLVNASAVGFYGARSETVLDESSSAGKGFLPDLCQAWEAEAKKAEAFGTRVVLLRTGIVLAKKGGALAKMLPPFRFFLGGPLGDGKQILSWIHLEDEVNAILAVLENDAVRGPVNLTAPNPVTMNDFSKTLAKALKRPAVFRVPPAALKVLLGEMSEMLLTGQNVSPRKLMQQGFRFRFVTLREALKDILNFV